MSWDGATAAWWRSEVAQDPAYTSDVDIVFAELLRPEPGGPWLDLGCGDGRLLGVTGAIGVDSSIDLAKEAGRAEGNVVVADVRRLPFADESFGGAYAVLVLEHVPDLAVALTAVRRVVAPGGPLVVVINHPAYTAPGSGPFLDPTDGEVLWRWGQYLEEGSTLEPAGQGSVRFHHRPMGALLTAAASSGWRLEHLIERSLSLSGDPVLDAQRQVPRLLGCRWR